jgi:hypothetical protein
LFQAIKKNVVGCLSILEYRWMLLSKKEGREDSALTALLPNNADTAGRGEAEIQAYDAPVITDSPTATWTPL